MRGLTKLKMVHLCGSTCGSIQSKPLRNRPTAVTLFFLYVYQRIMSTVPPKVFWPLRYRVSHESGSNPDSEIGVPPLP